MLVTEFGNSLMTIYRELERDFARLAERRLDPIIATVTRHSKSGAKVSVRGKLAKVQMKFGFIAPNSAVVSADARP